jgi:protein DGCR14
MAGEGSSASRMPPPRRRRSPPRPQPRRKTTGEPTVLDEDEYTARLEAIIERDYFPNLRSERLKASLLEATRKGDATAIAEIQREMGLERLRKCGSRGGVVGTPSIGGSGTTSLRGVEGGDGDGWETETPTRGRDDFREEFEYGREEEDVGEDGVYRSRNTAYDEDRHLSVDMFLAKYTSEDNASFSDIVRRSDERKEIKKRQLAEETAHPSKRLATLAAGKLSSGALVKCDSESNGKELAVDKHRRGHDDFYKTPEGLALSLKERQKMAVGDPKATMAKNTRFTAPPHHSADFTARSGKKTGQTYEPVSTPSMMPGVDASPLMTWGEIASTPLRLNDDESGSVGKFSMKQTSFREKKLRELTSKHASSAATPTPRTTRGIPTPRGLSAAAKSLLRRVTPARGSMTPNDMDNQLRKSYSGTPKVSSRSGASVPRRTRSQNLSDGGLLRLD